MRFRSQFLASQSARCGSIEDHKMTRSDSSWRQLSEVVGAVIGKLEPASTKAGHGTKKLAKTAQSR